MRRFSCQVCGAETSFVMAECDTCGTSLGFFPADGELRPIQAMHTAGYTTPSTGTEVWWRCLNFAWGCNWMVPADTGSVWCTSCQLTRGRPDDSSIDAVLAWSTTEQAKRRLIFQLWTLRMPIGLPSAENPNGVVFDLVYLPDSEGVTGHRPGLVTIDLREVDDRFREAARLYFGEPDRTVLGHLRHEIGHHFWTLLVEQLGAVDEFRSLFGDERIDYRSALERHYEHLGRPVPDSHVSGYATAHPSEDWAETFAHYLHLRDGLETVAAFGFDRATGHPDTLPSMLQRWHRVTSAVNEINLGLGHARPYPFALTPQVEVKLAFVHRQVELATR
ncbi:MAG: hypothetical protein JWN99_162 [Ilumatobacteraceae bacterium]|nr:hypothetical protein [Ilumatobacteraceae bacterium]